MPTPKFFRAKTAVDELRADERRELLRRMVEAEAASGNLSNMLGAMIAGLGAAASFGNEQWAEMAEDVLTTAHRELSRRHPNREA